MRIAFLALIVSIFMNSAWAQQSQRRCMLLPISDSVGGVLGYKVFEEIEYYLRQSTWCYYRSNSDIIDILSNYKTNLHEHLQNAEVLKILSEKTRAGSLIRIAVQSEVGGTQIAMEIIADNGSDLLFKESTRLESDNITTISQVIKNWLTDYEKRIPYDARIIGVLGDQFTIDIGREYGLVENRTARVIRPLEKKRHPLFNEIVEWESEGLGDAVIFHVVDLQSQGRIMAYDSNKKLQVNDWVILSRGEEKESEESLNFGSPKPENYQFGKIGAAGFALAIGSGSLGELQTNLNVRKTGGSLLGAELWLDLWITRNIWIGTEIAKKFGTFKKETGTFAQDEISSTTGMYKVKLGYKYLPLGFFYGPQVDGYIGYGRYTYGFDTSVTDRISDVAFTGVLLGGKGSIPFMSKFKAFLKLDFVFKPGFREDIVLLGEPDSTSNFNIGFGVSYDMSVNMSFIAGFDIAQSKATFLNPVRDMKYKETTLKLGSVFTF
jgi:hypothetical protein